MTYSFVFKTKILSFHLSPFDTSKEEGESATSYQALYSALPDSWLALVSIDEIEVTLCYQHILSTNAEY